MRGNQTNATWIGAAILGASIFALYCVGYLLRSEKRFGDHGEIVRAYPTSLEATLFVPAARMEMLLLVKHVETTGPLILIVDGPGSRPVEDTSWTVD